MLSLSYECSDAGRAPCRRSAPTPPTGRPHMLRDREGEDCGLRLPRPASLGERAMALGGSPTRCSGGITCGSCRAALLPEAAPVERAATPSAESALDEKLRSMKVPKRLRQPPPSLLWPPRAPPLPPWLSPFSTNEDKEEDDLDVGGGPHDFGRRCGRRRRSTVPNPSALIAAAVDFASAAAARCRCPRGAASQTRSASSAATMAASTSSAISSPLLSERRRRRRRDVPTPSPPSSLSSQSS